MYHWVDDTTICTLLQYIRSFCESVPEDYDYEQDEYCLTSVMRNWLINCIDKWLSQQLHPTATHLSIFQKCKMIDEKYKCMSEVCCLLLAFTSLEHGDDYKLFLQKYY